jgi:predicted NBD/HSP70 family sugar kinase
MTMSRELMGKIVDEVFDGAIEDASVIEQIYDAIKKHDTPSPSTQMVGVELPADIIESLLSIGPVEWGQTFCQSDEKHVEDFLDTLRITREHFGIEAEETTISYVALDGTGTVLASTGMSPNSRQHARILVGAWNQLVEIAKARAALTTEGQPDA